MASTYSTNTRLELMATGENSNTWGTKTNTNLTLIEEAISGKASVAMADANQTLTTNNGASDQARCMVVECTGALTANRDVVCPTVTKAYIVNNLTTGGYSIVFKTSGGTGVTVAPGSVVTVYCDGTNVVGETYVALGTAQVQALNVSHFGNLTTADVAVLGTASVQALNVEAVGSLTTAQIAVLGTASVQALNVSHFGNLTTADVAVLGTASVQALNVSHFGSLTTADVAVLGTASVQALNVEAVGSLTTTQIAVLGTAQVQALNASHFGSLTTAQVAVLGTANNFTGTNTFKGLTDTVYDITDGAAFEIDPANGSVQTITLGASRTPAATNFASGQSVVLGIDDGTAYSITWTTVNPVWIKTGGSAGAPTLATTGYTWLLFWKVGTTIYASEVGSP